MYPPFEVDHVIPECTQQRLSNGVSVVEVANVREQVLDDDVQNCPMLSREAVIQDDVVDDSDGVANLTLNGGDGMAGMAHNDGLQMPGISTQTGNVELQEGDLHIKSACDGGVNTHMDCMIIKQQLERWENTTVDNFFDPIASVEYVVSLQSAENVVDCTNATLYISSVGTTSNVVPKKSRGRPKRIHSLQEPPSTPSKNHLEALETWNLANMLGVKASNEERVLSALRKSKRLLVLEEKNTSG